MVRKIISIVVTIGLLFNQGGVIYAAGELNLSSYLSQLHTSLVKPDIFRPVHLRYFSYDSLNNSYKILLDKGDYTKSPSHQDTPDASVGAGRSPEEDLVLKETAQELMDYFLIGVTLPNDTFWVNLRPDAPDTIIDPELETTDIGKIFLEADLQLKKDTASFTSPQTPEGKQYWDKLYKKAGELFGSENITIPTLTRPWIVPNEIIVRETDDSAYVYKATLKVLLEEDYLKSSQPSALSPQQYNFKDSRLKELNEYSTQLIRETIIPKLTREVNSSQRYAKLRQGYYSLILSRWFKARFNSKESQGHQVTRSQGENYINLIDRRNLTNLTSEELWDKITYFNQYKDSFNKGEYNIKEPTFTAYGQSIRSYTSGGIGIGQAILPFEADMQGQGAGSPIRGGSFQGNNPVISDAVIGADEKSIVLDENLEVVEQKPVALAASPVTVEDADQKILDILEEEFISDIFPKDVVEKFKEYKSIKISKFSNIDKDVGMPHARKDIEKLSRIKGFLRYVMNEYTKIKEKDETRARVLLNKIKILQEYLEQALGGELSVLKEFAANINAGKITVISVAILKQWEKLMADMLISERYHAFVKHLTKRNIEFSRAGSLMKILNLERAGKRATQFKIKAGETLEKKYNPGDKFIFNDVLPDIALGINFGGILTDIIVNANPLLWGNVLILPDPSKCLSQYFNKEAAIVALNLLDKFNNPGYKLGFNGPGAFASVPQLHLQGFDYFDSTGEDKLPVENAEKTSFFSNNNVSIMTLSDWAVNTIVLNGSSLDSLNKALVLLTDILHKRNQPFNIVFTKNSDNNYAVYVFPRKLEGPGGVFGTGVAFLELAGAVLFTNQNFGGVMLKDKDKENLEQRIAYLKNIRQIIFGGGTIAEDLVQSVGLDWKDVSSKLIENGWAKPKNKTEVTLTASLEQVKDSMSRVFGDKWEKIISILEIDDFRYENEKNKDGDYVYYARPKRSGESKEITPSDLSNKFMHYIDLSNIVEILYQKAGREPELRKYYEKITSEFYKEKSVDNYKQAEEDDLRKDIAAVGIDDGTFEKILEVYKDQLVNLFSAASPLTTLKEKISGVFEKIQEKINDQGLLNYKEELASFLENLEKDLERPLNEIDNVVNGQGTLKDAFSAIEKISTILFNKEGEIGSIHTDIKSMMVSLHRYELPSLMRQIEKSLGQREITASPLTKQTVKDVQFNPGEKVFLRAEVNMPTDEQRNITDYTRLKQALPTIKYLIGQGVKLVIAGHLGRPQEEKNKDFSLDIVAQALRSELPGVTITFDKTIFTPKDAEGFINSEMKNGDILLLENVRMNKDEEQKEGINSQFAKDLFFGIDKYVSDAFGVMHRENNVSMVGAPKGMPRVAGLLVQKEIEYLNKILNPDVAIVGGAKVSDKIKIIEKLLEKADKILIGGAMTFAFEKAMGKDIGNSKLGKNKEEAERETQFARQLLEKAKGKIILPLDHIVADRFNNDAERKSAESGKIPDGWMGLDIGPETIKHYRAIIEEAETVIWNGPMGVFEFDNFEQGTRVIAEAMAVVKKKGGIAVVGGGDSAFAVEKFGLAGEMSHVSTGGGAALKFIEDDGNLPGILVLSDKVEGITAGLLGEEMSGVYGENAQPLRYVSVEDLTEGELSSLRSSIVERMTLSARETDNTYKNARFAVEIDQGKIIVWGRLEYNEKTNAISQIIFPNALNLSEDKKKDIEAAFIQAWDEESKINVLYTASPLESTPEIYVLDNHLSLAEGAKTGKANIGLAKSSLYDGGILNHSEERARLEWAIGNVLGRILYFGYERFDSELNRMVFADEAVGIWKATLATEGISETDYKEYFDLQKEKDKINRDNLQDSARSIVNRIINLQLKKLIASTKGEKGYPVKQVVLCVGEDLGQRYAGRTQDVLRQDIKEILKDIMKEDVQKYGGIGLRIAYEPRWAIGTGKTPTLEEIQNAHRFIKDTLKSAGVLGIELDVDYGGSLNAKNKEILSLPDVDGGLIGSAAKTVEAIKPVIEEAIIQGEKKGKILNIGMNWKAENRGTGLAPLGSFMAFFKSPGFNIVGKLSIAIGTTRVRDVKMAVLGVKEYYKKIYQAAASPLALENEVKVIQEVREKLNAYHSGTILQFSNVSLSNLIISVTKMANEIQPMNRMALPEEAQKWFGIEAGLVRIQAKVRENMEAYKKELAAFYAEIGQHSYIKLDEEQKLYYTNKYARDIETTNDVDVIIEAAEHAYRLRETYLAQEAQKKIVSQGNTSAASPLTLKEFSKKLDQMPNNKVSSHEAFLELIKMASELSAREEIPENIQEKIYAAVSRIMPVAGEYVDKERKDIPGQARTIEPILAIIESGLENYMVKEDMGFKLVDAIEKALTGHLAYSRYTQQIDDVITAIKKDHIKIEKIQEFIKDSFSQYDGIKDAIDFKSGEIAELLEKNKEANALLASVRQAKEITAKQSGNTIKGTYIDQSLFDAMAWDIMIQRVRIDKLEEILDEQVSRTNQFFTSDSIKLFCKEFKEAGKTGKKRVLVSRFNEIREEGSRTDSELIQLRDYLAGILGVYYLKAAEEVRSKLTPQDTVEYKEALDAAGQVIDLLLKGNVKDQLFSAQLDTVVKAWDSMQKSRSSSALTAEEFILAVDALGKMAKEKTISYETAFDRMVGAVSALEKDVVVPYAKIADELYSIIHNGVALDPYRLTLWEDAKETLLRRKKYAREGILDMIEKRLEIYKRDLAQKAGKDLSKWIGALTAHLGAGIRDYKEHINSIKSTEDLLLTKVQEFSSVNRAVQKKEWSDDKEKYYEAMKRKGVSIDELKGKLDEIDKYNEFLLTVAKAREAISAGQKSSSSSLVAQEPAQDFAIPEAQNTFGGIDMTDRALHINFERWGSLADIEMELPKLSHVEAIDLDNEYQQIQAMASSGIRPSDTRILEFIAACYYREEFSQRLSEITACLKEAHALDEREGKESSETLRLATLLPDALYVNSLN